MDTDDLEAIPKKVEKRNLDILSIESLHDYISELEDEIQRVRETIVQKKSAKVSADSFFKN